MQTSSSGPKLGEQAGLGADVGGEEGRQGGAAPPEAESPRTDPSGARDEAAQGTAHPSGTLPGGPAGCFCYAADWLLADPSPAHTSSSQKLPWPWQPLGL